MTNSDLLILCAAGMLVSAYLMVGQKALVTAIRLYGTSVPAPRHRGGDDRRLGVPP